MALPVFVAGRNRSGTTWLANQLCAHPQIVGVQHERHHGIHESAYFTRIVGRYGRLSKRINFAEFVEVVSASDFFRLAGADAEFLYSLWPATYEEVFRRMMDRFAERQGALAWVEKTALVEGMVPRVFEAYPDARFVCIERDVVSNIASSIANPRVARQGRRPWTIVRGTSNWVLVRKIIRAAARREPDRVMLVAFEQMRADLEPTMRRILDWLGLPWDARVLEQTYPPNTTFRSRQARQHALSPTGKWLVRATAMAGRLLPRPLLVLGDRLLAWRRGRIGLPNWFFRLAPFFEGDPEQYDAYFGHPGTTKTEESDAKGPSEKDAQT